MNHIQSLLYVAIIVALTFFTFDMPYPSQAAQKERDQFSCTNVTEIPQIECEVLVALSNRTDGGPNWPFSINWLETNMPCSWIGVVCEGGHITEL